MILKRDPTKALQLGFLAMLVIATAQVAWWIADQRWLAWSEQDRVVALYEADAKAVTTLVGDASRGPDDAGWVEIASDFPHVVFDPVTGTASVRPEAVDLLTQEVASRINRYAWEGGFFLLVLIVGMLVLTRAIRHDAQLRRRQQNFIAAVSHEFKSPLASMRLSAETLAARGGDEDSRRLGRRLVEDGDRLLRLVDNLLDTARVDDGGIGLRRENVPLRAVIEAARAEHSVLAGSRGIDIRVEVPDVDLDADPVAIESVIRNLLDNAVKACILGDGREIAIEAQVEGSTAKIVVADDGAGFPPREAALIFDKFYRSGEAAESPMPGTGLGLYVVRRLAELSDARVEAMSEGPGRGARLTVTWPVA